jgi:hypothetical protein
VDERLELAGDAAPVCRRRVSSVVGPRALIKEVQRWSGGGRSPGGNTQRVRAARAMATTTTASLGQRADGHAFEAVGSFALLLRVGPNKPLLPTAPTSLTPAPSSPSPSRPLPARPSTTSLSASLPAAARASLYHLALCIPPGRCPRVPPPLRASQFARPLPARPATTSRFAVLSAASRASRHHFTLRSSLGRVHCVLPPRRSPASRSAASIASFHHVALRSSLGRVPRVPSPLCSSQYSQRRSVRPSTTSLFRVRADAFRASLHHLALRVPIGRVPCVPPRFLMHERACFGWHVTASRRARRRCTADPASRGHQSARGSRVRARGARANSAREEGRTAHGVGAHCAWAHGARAWVRGMPGIRAHGARGARLDGREGAVVGSRRGRDGRRREGGRRSEDREGAWRREG